MYKATEIIPCNNQKSFYGKAIQTETANTYYLKSYNTIVCSIDKETGEFSRHWGGYSATTAKHINAFRTMHGFDTINKNEWVSLPTKEDRYFNDLLVSTVGSCTRLF